MASHDGLTSGRTVIIADIKVVWIILDQSDPFNSDNSYLSVRMFACLLKLSPNGCEPFDST